VLKSKSSDQTISWRDLNREPTHPGIYVKEVILDGYGLTQQELANAIGVSRLSINEIVRGRRNITEITALRLGRLTGTSPEFWLNLQRNFSLWRAHKEERSILKSITPLASRGMKAE
jgi:addiction module HigA family antidote